VLFQFAVVLVVLIAANGWMTRRSLPEDRPEK
jgi:hypothetical protein